eukprot:365711-Chlamydomonas_euryale.AAC.4
MQQGAGAYTDACSLARARHVSLPHTMCASSCALVELGRGARTRHSSASSQDGVADDAKIVLCCRPNLLASNMVLIWAMLQDGHVHNSSLILTRSQGSCKYKCFQERERSTGM